MVRNKFIKGNKLRQGLVPWNKGLKLSKLTIEEKLARRRETNRLSRLRNIAKYRATLHQYYLKNKEKLILKQKERMKDIIRIEKIYEKDRIRNLNPIEKYKTHIRNKTKHSFPLNGKLCLFCNSPATSHHHYTIPYEYDKFWFVCKECHLIKDKELKNYINNNGIN